MPSEELLLLTKILEVLRDIGEKLGVPVRVEVPSLPAPPPPPAVPSDIAEAVRDVLERLRATLDLYMPHDEYFTDEPSVKKGEPYELEVEEKLGRAATRGYIINDGADEVFVVLNRRTTRKIRLRPSEQLDITDLKLSVRYVRITTESTSPVRIRLLLV